MTRLEIFDDDFLSVDLYAQLYLLTGVTGRSLKRKKLDFTPSENDAFELNGNLSFDLTPNQLENVTLLIVLYAKVGYVFKLSLFFFADIR